MPALQDQSYSIYGHIEKLEAPIRKQVRALLKKTSGMNQQATEFKMDLPAEISRREQRLKTLAKTKTKIVEPVTERNRQERQDNFGK